MKGIRAIQSEGWHTLLERENVHNSTSALRCSRGEEVFPKLLPSVFASHEANFVLPLVVASPPGFLAPGSQVFHTTSFISWNVPHNSISSRRSKRSFSVDHIQVGFCLAMEPFKHLALATLI